MIQTPMDVLKHFPVRKSKIQKLKFRESAKSYIATLGYTYHEETGSSNSQNLIFGDPSKASYLITAHYDTPPRMFLPNLCTPQSFWVFFGYQMLITLVFMAIPVLPGIIAGMLINPTIGYWVWYLGFLVVILLMRFGPANPTNANDNTSGVVTLLEVAKSIPAEHREKVCFILFDLEERGMVGSKSYAKAHKAEIQNQIVLNLDCVGDGDKLMMFPTRKLSKDPDKMAFLRKLTHTDGNKSLNLHENGFCIYNSDQKSFPYGAALGAFKRGKIGLYCNRIHTAKDTILDEENVYILRDRIIAAITG